MRYILSIIRMFSLVFIVANANAQEIKIGIMQHDFDAKLNHRHEEGKNIIIEYMLDKTQNFLRAFPHIGASLNNKGYTSNIYTGLTWHFDLGKNFLIEASLGASINNSECKKTSKKRALGSNILFRESFSAGLRFAKIHSITIIIDHISSADIKKPNPGLTDIGLRYGYRL